MVIDKKFIQSVVDDIEGASSGRDAKVDYWLDSGNYSLNKVISGSYTKGLPFGRVIECFGDPSTGKSLLIYHWISLVQKMGGIAILDDSEDTYSEEFGEMLGIDNDALILISSLTVEEHFEKVFTGWESAISKDDEDDNDDKKKKKRKLKPGLIDLIWEKDTNCPILVALDSLALLSTRHEQAVAFGSADMSKAKIIRAALRLSSPYMKRGHIMHVISNHVTQKIGVMFGPKTTTPGGTGIPFSASVRLELNYMGKIKDGEKVIGVKSLAKAAKNKITAPFKQTELEIFFDRGVDPYSGLMEDMIAEGIITDSKEEGRKKGYLQYGSEVFKKSDFADFIKNKIAIPSEKTEKKA